MDALALEQLRALSWRFCWPLTLCNILGFACWKTTCKNALERQCLEPDPFLAFPNSGMLRADVLTQITRGKEVSE